ncbi:hypothetical protein TESG_02017 [Trichophyton tonsurans CBS 112818]|uniref:Benzoate 4-monooxygenase cytochrome P450 n=1 Tax=Trichophyton tonsurans (strain CBS 112818) TaxID=647933 RepID=F2RT52_TRIT1|nr:hypothetical protein TESG_02017 [Trichophyton tonsurans CBS 112818]
MSPFELLGLTAGLWVVCHVLLAVYNVFLHPLRKYPGPILDAATQLPYVYHMIKGDNAKYIAKLHEKYGDIVRVGPREISYTSASANRTIFGGRPTEETVFEKNPVVWLQGSGEIHNIFFARHREHVRYRKMMAPAFSEAAIREQEPVIQEYVTKFIDGMRERSGKACYPDANGVVNIQAWYNFFVFDILSRLSFGTTVGSLDQGDYHPWVTVISGAIKHSQYVQAAHRLRPYHRLLELFIPKAISEPYDTHMEFAGKTLLERQKGDSIGRADFASFILKGMSEAELLDNVNILVTAGGDTTAATMTSMTYYLTHNPESYRKLVDEIRETFQAEEEITVSSVANLKYLRAVIQETMRIHPPVPVGLHRVVPRSGAAIDGQWLPGETWVSVAPLAAYRSPRYWRDPEKFIPERWLGEPAFESDHRDVCTPFSIGQRSCIGINLAKVNLRLVIARLLWSFDLEAQPDNVDPHDHLEYGVWQGEPLRVRVKVLASS